MKGIVLAGGTGTRLWPATRSVNKQLLTIYDKPMIYYPISTLMMAGIREMAIITTPSSRENFREQLGNGSQWGIELTFLTQDEPKGIAQALLVAEKYLGNESSLLILGDNIFYGTGIGKGLNKTFPEIGAHIFTYEVSEPWHYGVLTLNNDGEPVGIAEKPKNSKSKLAITGLYYFDNTAQSRVKELKPSLRGELEITDLLQLFLMEKLLTFTKLSRGSAWLDTGNPKSLNDAGNFIRIIEERTGLKISCPEEISWRQGWISDAQLKELSQIFLGNQYGTYLEKLLETNKL